MKWMKVRGHNYITFVNFNSPVSFALSATKWSLKATIATKLGILLILFNGTYKMRSLNTCHREKSILNVSDFGVYIQFSGVVAAFPRH